MTANITTIVLSALAGVAGALVTLLVVDRVLDQPQELVASTLADSAVPQGQSNPDGAQARLATGEPVDPALKFDALPLAIQNELQFLRDEVDLARRERHQLDVALTRMSQQVDGQIRTDDPSNTLLSTAPNEPDAPTNQPTATRSDFFNPPTRQERLASLQAAGVEPQIALDLQQRIDQQQLARLELTDRAEREGWRRSARFRDEVSALDENRLDLADEIGPDRYDRYLFDSGQNNRVQIDSVIAGSAASFAGIAAGDIILRYADTPVFTTRGLQAATRAGTRNESVTINALRGGDQLVFDVPRGPLGVTLSGLRMPPG